MTSNTDYLIGVIVSSSGFVVAPVGMWRWFLHERLVYLIWIFSLESIFHSFDPLFPVALKTLICAPSEARSWHDISLEIFSIIERIITTESSDFSLLCKPYKESMIDMSNRHEESCFLEIGEEFWRENMKSFIILCKGIK